ncbi:MAG: TonB-dependent receptor [Candidatus Dadabacteria bacterium]|nr:TonB-dependent receptor [Candidatus Dadabacteria bacterium]NIQ14016.1 TonB-dependent receptor [Candidatus Dadabacteria bacterium]
MKRKKYLYSILLFFIFLIFYQKDVNSHETLKTLADYSLEELMQMDVTTVSKKHQTLFKVPSAVYVITGEDLRRSGVRNIPDALRIVPGVEVAQINSNQWAVSIRGFNSNIANKLLVLIDGKSAYTPLFAGVFWSDLDTLFEDIDRIEIIRGPGGSIWGANAVNGVINIITKNSKHTNGYFVNAGIGNEEKAFIDIRYGNSALNNKLNYRIFAKAFDKDEFKSISNSGGANDDWKSYRSGFRIDYDRDSKNSFSIIGDINKVDANRELNTPILSPPFSETIKEDAENKGFSIIGKWNRFISNNSELSFQFYYDYYDKLSEFAGEKRHTIDFELLHNFSTTFITSHEINWGLGFRLTTDDITETPFLEIRDSNQTNELYSAFVQDQISIINNKLFLILGTKLEHNDFTGFEIQPNAKILFTPDDDNTFWLSASRAVRTTSRIEDGVLSLVLGFPDPITNLPALVFAVGSDDFDSENLYAIEMGYRTKPRDWITFDLSLFYNFYYDLEFLKLSGTEMSSDPIDHIRILMEFENELEADTYGFEVATNFVLTRFWKLKFNYSYLNIDIEDTDVFQIDEDTFSLLSRFSEDFSPKNQIKIQSFLDLTDKLEFDASLYWVDDIKTAEFENISDYTRLDLRLAYKFLNGLEFSITGQNILDNSHKEFGNAILGNNSNIERSIFGSIIWRK